MLEHIDKIARKKIDVIFISFNREIFSSYDYEEYDERKKLLALLESNNIAYSMCGQLASENGWESYRGQLYLDAPIDESN